MKVRDIPEFEMQVDKDIKWFEETFDKKLSDWEQTIFVHAYLMGQKSKDDEVIEIK